MKVEFDLTEHELEWENNASLRINQPSKKLIEINGNREGLISLAKQLLVVAYSDEYVFVHHQAEVNTSQGYEYGDLDEGSLDLSIVKVERDGRKLG